MHSIITYQRFYNEMSDRKAKGKHKKDHEKGAYLKITETVEKK